MKKEKAYCSKCDEDVEFTTQETTRTVTIRKITFDYIHIIANCKTCGERVFPVSIGTLNDKTKYEELAKALLKEREGRGISMIKYYKSVYFDKDQEYKELGIGETNQRILVNRGELALNLLNYNKKVPIEVEQITIDEYLDFMADDNYFGLDWIDRRLTDLTIKEVRKEE